MPKLRIRHFQSIKDTTLEIDGFVAITGPSNRGKSALIRAVEGCWFGIPGDFYVQRGENRVNVIWLDDRHKVRWQKVVKRRVGEETYLEVDGQMNTKLGREHLDLTEKIGFVEITAGATRLRPQVANQHDPIFLLTQNETIVAEIFKLLGRVDVVTSAQQMARQDVLRDNRLLATRKEDEKRAEEELEELDGVVQLRQDLEDLGLELVNLEFAQEDKRRTLDKIRRLKTLEPTDLPRAPFPPEWKSTTSLLDKLERLRELELEELPIAPEIEFEWKKARTQIVKVGYTKRLGEYLGEVGEDIEEENGNIRSWGEELEAMKREIGICPTCERSFSEHG